MQQAPTALILLLILVGMLSTSLAAWALGRSRVTGAREYSFTMFCSAIYAFGYAVELSRTDIKGVLEAIRFEYLGISLIPLFIALFILRFLYEKPAPWYVAVGLAIIPIITLCLVMTVDRHNLFYQNPRLENGPWYAALVFERGPWYYVHWANIQFLPLVMLALMIRQIKRVSPRKRTQLIFISASLVIPGLSGVPYFMGVIPGNLDTAPIGVGLSGLISGLALFKLGLFELVPAARELALDSVHDGFMVIDRRGQLQDLNKAAWRLPGAQHFVVGAALPAESHLTAAIQPLLRGDRDQIDFSGGDAEQEMKFYQAKAYPILNAPSKSSGTAILIHDVTETTSLLKKLDLQANTDGLTGLLNRRQLMQLGALEVDHSRQNGLPLGVIMIDLDHFKQINDVHGHGAGDMVLKSVADCLRMSVRNFDILGRYGGEEFVILLPDTDLHPTAAIAERIRQRLNDWEIAVEGGELMVTASFGVYAEIAAAETTLDGLLNIADRAMYQAKADGRNCVRRGDLL